MSSAAEVLRELLIEQGLGTLPTLAQAWPIYVSFLPDEKDNALCIYDVAGRLDGRLMATGEQIEHKGFQVMVRGTTYTEVWEKVQAVALAFDAIEGSAVAVDSANAYTLNNVSRSGCPVSLGLEEVGDRRRYVFTINGVVTMRQD